MSPQWQKEAIMALSKRIRIIITKIGLDGHDLGAKFVSRILREAGMEVIYLGLFQTPEAIVDAAIQEDADVIGISCLSQTHTILIPEVLQLLKEKGRQDIPVIAGGVIPEPFASELHQAGVSEVVGSHVSSDAIIKHITSIASKKS